MPILSPVTSATAMVRFVPLLFAVKPDPAAPVTEPVDVIDNGAVVVSGRLGDVDGHGRLLIEVGGGPPRTVSVGDVVFRDSPP